MPRPSRYIFQAGKNTRTYVLTNRAIICKTLHMGHKFWLGWSNLLFFFFYLLTLFLSASSANARPSKHCPLCFLLVLEFWITYYSHKEDKTITGPVEAFKTRTRTELNIGCAAAQPAYPCPSTLNYYKNCKLYLKEFTKSFSKRGISRGIIIHPFPIFLKKDLTCFFYLFALRFCL